MKKLLLSTSLLVNIVFLLLACTKEDTLELKGNPPATASNGRASLQNPAADDGTTGCSGPYAGMPYALVWQMINNYKTNQQQAIENSLGFNDANSCWFELEKIKEFICHLETAVLQSNCDNIRSLGLRFYYGAHTSNPAAYGMPGNYAGLHNLVIIPTYRNTAGANVDFDPSRIDLTTCTPLPFSQLDGGAKLRNLMIANTSASANIFAMNHGQLGPPDTVGVRF
jgi:hypothetical protein